MSEVDVVITKNPYSGRGAPVSGERMVGRDIMLKRLTQRIADRAHCSIVGLPRHGKTSVAREAVRLTVGSHSSSAYITLDAIRGPSHAYDQIIEETSINNGSDFGYDYGVVDHDRAYHSLRRVLSRRCSAGIHSVVVIDEFDAIIRADFADAQLFVARLRELANYREKYGITFVFVSRRSLDMIQGVVDCSTLAGLCEVLYLPPLDYDGVRSLALRCARPVAESAVAALWRLTGGHPFLGEVVMCEAVERSFAGLDASEIEEAQSRQAHEFTNQYRQLERVLEQDGMYAAFCEVAVGPRWRTIEPHTDYVLKHYGLLRPSSDIVGRIDVMSEHLRDYLTLQTRTRPSWEVLGDAERQLRYLVHDRMTDTFGEHWIRVIQERAPHLYETLQKLGTQRTREQRQFGAAASDFMLDYAYIGDLKDIIFAEWNHFRVTLGGSKADWERKFQDVMKVRNPIAHHRQVPADALQEAQRACEFILARLSGID